MVLLHCPPLFTPASWDVSQKHQETRTSAESFPQLPWVVIFIDLSPIPPSLKREKEKMFITHGFLHTKCSSHKSLLNRNIESNKIYVVTKAFKNCKAGYRGPQILISPQWTFKLKFKDTPWQRVPVCHTGHFCVWTAQWPSGSPQGLPSVYPPTLWLLLHV